MDELCPHCKSDLEESAFTECVKTPQKDITGKTITSHRIGCCPNCWEKIEIINGKIGHSVLIYMPEVHFM